MDRKGGDGVMGAVTVRVNRAPVLTLWAAVVAQRLGFKWDEAPNVRAAGAPCVRDGIDEVLYVGRLVPSTPARTITSPGRSQS